MEKEFWAKKYGISEREWVANVNKYQGLGAKAVPPYAVLDCFWNLLSTGIDKAIEALSHHYNIPSPPVIKSPEQKNKQGGEYKDGQIILYPLAFEKDKPSLANIVLHEFAHHLLHLKYPFTGAIKELYEKSPGYTFVQRELFADSFSKESMLRLGYVFVKKSEQGTETHS